MFLGNLRIGFRLEVESIATLQNAATAGNQKQIVSACRSSVWKTRDAQGSSDSSTLRAPPHLEPAAPASLPMQSMHRRSAPTTTERDTSTNFSATGKPHRCTPPAPPPGSRQTSAQPDRSDHRDERAFQERPAIAPPRYKRRSLPASSNAPRKETRPRRKTPSAPVPPDKSATQ